MNRYSGVSSPHPWSVAFVIMGVTKRTQWTTADWIVNSFTTYKVINSFLSDWIINSIIGM